MGSGGLLELPCAYGKTTLALHICSDLKVKALVIVHKEFLLNQWVERIRQFLPTARIGRIQGTTIDIENKDIVIGMLQSLSMKDYPEGTFSSFGLTIIDEVHHISSEVFSCALFKIVTKYMLGLSATMNRKDGTTKVFKMFLGDVVYKGDRDQEHDVIVRGIQYRSDDDEFNSTVTNFRGDIIYSTMISKLCGYNKRSEFILRVLSDMIKENSEQQIMILAHNKSLLTYLHDAIDARKIASVGYYVGGMKEAALKETETKKVVIATYSMASEALDIKTLTTLIMATPKTDIEQSIGRILRQRHTNPIVVDIIDQHEPFIRQWYKRRKFYVKHNYQIVQTTSTKYTPDTKQWTTSGTTKTTKKTPTKKTTTTINTQESVLQQLLNNSGVVENIQHATCEQNDDSDNELLLDPEESRNNAHSKCLI
jgi:superfamily II DNA or RNA helicase